MIQYHWPCLYHQVEMERKSLGNTGTLLQCCGSVSVSFWASRICYYDKRLLDKFMTNHFMDRFMTWLQNAPDTPWTFRQEAIQFFFVLITSLKSYNTSYFSLYIQIIIKKILFPVLIQFSSRIGIKSSFSDPYSFDTDPDPGI